MDQCRSVKKNGDRCQYKAKEGYGGFCGLHFPTTDTKLVPAEGKLAKFQKYVAIGTGLATIIKFVIDAIHHVSPTGRDAVWDLPYASRSTTLYERAEGLSLKASQSNANSEDLTNDAATLDKDFNFWYSELPRGVKSAIYEYLDKEKRTNDDLAILKRKLFYAVMQDYDRS